MADSCDSKTSSGVTIVDPSTDPGDSTTNPEDCPTTFGELCGGTCCNGDRRHNVWIEGETYNPETGEGGICMLDNLNEAQVIDIISRDPIARRDLKKITTHPYLLQLAETVPALSSTEESDALMKESGQRLGAPAFYAQFRGQPPFVS